MLDMLDIFQKISVETPVDEIIGQIQSLISSGQIKPGDRLPSERKLTERLGIRRIHVRNAYVKLEHYGFLKTMPLGGPVVKDIGKVALEGLITHVLKLEQGEFADLVESRVVLEIQAAKLAAQRRTPDDIITIKNALDAYEAKVKMGDPAVEEDLLFHLAIAKAARNTVLESLMLIVTPDIVKNFNKLGICKDGRFYRSLEEHKVILKHILKQEPELAAKTMEEHLQDIIEYSLAS